MTDPAAIAGPAARARWMRVGASRADDGATAAAEATRAVLADGEPRLVLVFASIGLDFDAIAPAVGDLVGDDIPVVGCSTAAPAAMGGRFAPSLLVVGLGGEGVAASATGVSAAAGELRDAAAEAAACLGDVADRNHQVLLLFGDGADGDQQEIVRGAYSVAGAGVPLVGASAARRGAWRGGVLLNGPSALSDGVVAAAIGSDAPLGVAARHGWRPVGAPVLVTSATGNRVRSLDGAPALDRYLERVDAPASARQDSAAFSEFALTRPLGLVRGAGEPFVRRIVAADFETRELVFSTEVPHGGIVWPLEGHADALLEASDAAAAAAVAPLGTTPPSGLIAFGGDARRAALAHRLPEEARALSTRAGGRDVAVVHTSGQVARTHGIAGFHTQSFVVLAVG